MLHCDYHTQRRATSHCREALYRYLAVQSAREAAWMRGDEAEVCTDNGTLPLSVTPTPTQTLPTTPTLATPSPPPPPPLSVTTTPTTQTLSTPSPPPPLSVTTTPWFGATVAAATGGAAVIPIRPFPMDLRRVIEPHVRKGTVYGDSISNDCHSINNDYHSISNDCHSINND